LSQLPKNNDPNLLVGYESSDDAGVYQISDDQALVTTADFITPPVDDPYEFGQIAAANAISDVYAMGGTPLACLNLVSFPPDKLDDDVLHQIIAGAFSKITEAGAVLAGGHSVENDEPKFGLSVTGIVHPQKYWSNNKAKAGEKLILTKAVGTGVLLNANLKHMVSEKAIARCLNIMKMLNKDAADAIKSFLPSAVTDVTGFGLVGHGYEMASGSGVTLEITIDTIPVLDEALDMYQKGVSTGVNDQNRILTEGHVRFDREIPAWHQEIVFDPQTSGGLLVSISEDQAEQLLDSLLKAGITDSAIIGKTTDLQGSDYMVFK
jgi:selenide,water dikinase